jgi:hypothetical protein
MKLLIHELPNDPTPKLVTERTLRHWVTLDDGRLFYQDEVLTWSGEDRGWTSERGLWFALPLPETSDVVVATVADLDGTPLVFMRSGRVFRFGVQDGDTFPHFYEGLDAVPGTALDRHTDEVMGR